MKEANIERVQTDLETLRGAMDLDLPFDEKDIWLTLGIAASLLLPILVNLEERPEGAEWFSFLPMATLGSISVYRMIHRAFAFARATNAGMKKESRFSAIFAIIIVPSAFALKKWGFVAGLPDMSVASVIGVSVGLLFCLLPLWNRNLVYYLGFGPAIIAIGLAAPFCPRDLWIPFVLAVVILGTLASAMIMRWQLDRANHSGHGA